MLSAPLVRVNAALVSVSRALYLAFDIFWEIIIRLSQISLSQGPWGRGNSLIGSIADGLLYKRADLSGGLRCHMLWETRALPEWFVFFFPTLFRNSPIKEQPTCRSRLFSDVTKPLKKYKALQNKNTKPAHERFSVFFSPHIFRRKKGHRGRMRH